MNLKTLGRWFKPISELITTSDLSLYFGSERWERSYRTSRSLQSHRASMNYMVTGASFALRYKKGFRFHITDEGLSKRRNVC